MGRTMVQGLERVKNKNVAVAGAQHGVEGNIVGERPFHHPWLFGGLLLKYQAMGWNPSVESHKRIYLLYSLTLL